MTPPPPQPVVLYAEDDENDVFLFERAVTKAGLAVRLVIVSDGTAAIDYLQQAIADRQPFPALVLLDLNMPRVSGLEVLAWARLQPTLTAVPIVVFTSSMHASDQAEARRLGVAAYAIKPSHPQDAIAFARSLARFLSPPPSGARSP